MKKRRVGNSLVLGLVLLNLVLWGAFPPQNTLETNYSLQFVGEVIASTAMILIAITLVLAAKLRFLEPYFGGLDQMWQTHKKVAMLAFLSLILHFFTIPKTNTLINGKPIGMLSFLLKKFSTKSSILDKKLETESEPTRPSQWGRCILINRRYSM